MPRTMPALEQQFESETAVRREAATRVDREAFLASDARVRDIRAQAATIVRETTGDQRYTDVNYVFPTFITTHLPVGLVGLMIAAIFSAAMSASGGELNALATATVIDFYKRYLAKEASESHYIMISRFATLLLGGCLPAWWRCIPRTRARSSSRPTVTARSSTASLLGVFILAAIPDHARDRDRRLLRTHRRHGGGSSRCELHPDRLPLAQPDWRRGRCRCGNGRQPGRSFRTAADGFAIRGLKTEHQPSVTFCVISRTTR